MTIPSAGIAGRWTVVVATAALFVAVTLDAVPRQTDRDGRLTFEAATIKLAAADAVRNRVMPAGPNRMHIPSMSLVWLVYTAYGDGGFNTAMRVTGGPDWANSRAFAVEGIASGTATPQQLRLMLQSLLEDRFALKIRTETQAGKANNLIVERAGRLGPNVREWDGTCRSGQPSAADEPTTPRCPSGYRAGGLSIEGATMFSVAEFLSLPQSRPRLDGTITHDRTGLTGRYTLELDYAFSQGRPANPTAPAGEASLYTVIQEQWGLRVVPGPGTLKVVTIENAQPPAEN